MKNPGQNSENAIPPFAVCRYGMAAGLSDCEFQSFSELIESECGLNLGVEKRAFLESRLRKRMDLLEIRIARDYYCLLKDRAARERELPVLLDSMMICETAFFRNMPQFDLLRDVVFPELLSEKERIGSRLLRVWSAGCSTGQEPYSLVICLNECVANREEWMVRVFASDLSFTALEKAQAGLYRRDQLKGILTEQLEKYFIEEESGYLVQEFTKRDVVFGYHNLKHDNGLRGLDLIFCRNVLIYFSVEEQRRLIEHLAGCLMPGGYLFLGHAESLQGLSKRFSMIHRNKGIAYRLEE
jgi:chemotaxis protein methyltransferase CheR